jgi:tetratricopeptide (TPR) repeat protein
MFLANLSGAQTALGRYQAASESARNALVIAEEIDQQPFRAQALVALALAEHAQGRSEDAERLVNRALELSNDQAAQWQTVSARTLLGEIYFDIGQFEKAQPFLQAAIDGAEKAGYEELAVRSACYLAAIAGISDNDKDADRQLSELAELTEGLYLWYVCQRLRGHMKLVGIGSESDKAEAIAHLKEVRAATEKAEYKLETDRIDAVLAAVG